MTPLPNQVLFFLLTYLFASQHKWDIYLRYFRVNLIKIVIKDKIHTALWASGILRWLNDKESICQCRKFRRHGFSPWGGMIQWRRKCQPTAVFLHGKSHGQKSLVGYSPWGCKRVGHDWATKQKSVWVMCWTISCIRVVVMSALFSAVFLEPSTL